jgi:hypothetical protein
MRTPYAAAPSWRRALGLAGVALAAAAAPGAAQGTLSGQGYGYPPGQLSTQALGTGGALAEFDAVSPINPASLRFWTRGGLFFQYAPEFKQVEAAGGTDKITAARFPLIAAAIPFRERGFIGLSASTLLDRTWATSLNSGQRIGEDSVTFTEHFKSDGGINDLRLAGSWAFSNQLTVGAGVHLFTGENRLAVSRVYSDTNTVAPIDTTQALSFIGTGFSGGVIWRPVRSLGLAASGRIGGTLKVQVADTVLREAKAPARMGFGMRFDGLTGAVIAARADYTRWSDMSDLGSANLDARDAWDLGVGGEFAGPRALGTQLALRIGARRRTLPFDASGQEVRENAFSGGIGVPLANGHALFDMTVQRAMRTAKQSPDENAWTLSFGVTIRP